ncbi:MAG: methyltransferase domain-containing protein [bacterium]
MDSSAGSEHVYSALRLTRVAKGNTAHVTVPPDVPDALRVEIKSVASDARYDVQLSQGRYAATSGHRYVVSLSARADGQRSIAVGFGMAHEPWANLGLYDVLDLTSAWQQFDCTFVANASDDDARVLFDVGGNAIAVELSVVTLRNLTNDEAMPPTLETGLVERTETVEHQASMDTADGHSQPSETPLEPGGRLRRFQAPTRALTLGDHSTEAIFAEVLARIEAGAFSSGEKEIILGCALYDALAAAIDVHNNRWSAHRYRDLLSAFYKTVPQPRPPLDGATIVDLGCGGKNPFGLLFLFLMLGAQRGIGVDLDEIEDDARAARGLADLAATMLIDPDEILERTGYRRYFRRRRVQGADELAVSREQLLRNVSSFDLGKLRRGDPAGIDADRLEYRHESVHALSFPDAEADIVISNAFFEHIPRIDDAIAEIARITKAGGLGVHVIDGVDHRIYDDASCHPLEFLTEPGDDSMLRGTNRVRPMEFIALFERHGFEVVAFQPFNRVDITPDVREQLSDPWQSMSDEMLSVYNGKIIVRRS